VIVANRAVFAVYILPSSLPKDQNRAQGVVNRLAGVVNVSSVAIWQKINKNRFRPFEPVLIKDRLAPEMVARLSEMRQRQEGMVVRYRPVRFYPYGKLAAHVLGYVGEIEPAELNRLHERGFKMGDFIGKAGVEKNYDAVLRGVDGGQKFEVDVRGNPVRMVSSSDPVPGNDLYLTLDIELQKAAEEAFDGLNGAGVILNPKTGEILAMLSRPVFDPQIFAEPIDAATWREVNRVRFPFMNRALSAYPPGSTFKLITLSAVLQEKLVNPREMFHCPGYFRLGQRVAKCWRTFGHGMLSPLEALVWSCDVAFYEMGLRAGVDLMAKYAGYYGLGEKTGIDLPGEKEGLMPTEKWKRDYLHQPWFKGDTINVGIGQGYVQVTPLQLAQAYAAIAVGKRYRPFVVSKVVSRRGRELFKNEIKMVFSLPLSRDNQLKIKDALWNVVKRATGVAAYVPGLPAGGKTGTAENPGLPHAWFVCFAPVDDPEIVVVSFVEHGQHGDQGAARIAGKILQWYKEHRLTKKYPEEPRKQQYILHGTYPEPYFPKPVTTP
ncbi:MAG: penicillin-binding protein 2, partial [Candidatus Margulisiibacteriota bacterium]